MAPGLTDNECSVCQKRKSRRWFVPLDDESPPLCKSCHAKNAKSGLKKPPPLTCTIVEKDGKRIGYARPNPESAFRRSALLYKASEDEAQSLVEATGTSSDAPDLAKVSDRPENPSPTDDAQVLLEVAAPGGQQSGSAINGGRADPGPQTAGGVLPPSVLATKEQLQESREELPADLRARELARKPQKEAAKVDGRRGAGASSEQGQEGSVLPALPASAGQQESPQDVAEVPRKGVLAPAIGQEADFLAAHIVEGARRRSKRRVSQESASDVLMTSARKPSGVKRAKRKTAVETDAEEERPEKKRSLQEIDERSVQRVSKPAPKAAHAEKLSPSAEERGEEVEKASYGTGQQCVGCGATASRRWYGGGNKCSKCYDREYEKKRRARSGGSEGEGSAPSNEVWGVEAPGAFQLAINGSEPSGGVKRKRGRPPLGKPKPLPGKNVAAEPNEPGRKRGRPPLGKPKAPPEEETAKPDEPGRKQGRAPLGTSNPPAGKEMAAEPDEAGQCADCGRRETSRWYGGAGGPQSQCQKCREKGLGGVCQSCGAESSSVWYGGSQGPRTTCSACYAERLNPKDSGAALEGAAKGGSLSAEMNVSEAVSGEGIPLTRELVSRRVEVWCPVDNRFNAGRIVCFRNWNKWHQVRYDDGTKEMLNLAKERWKLFPQKDKSVHEENALEERGPERSGVSEPDGGSRKEAAGNPDTAGDDSGLDSSLPIGNWARNTNSVPKPIGNRKKEHREDAAVRRAEKSALPTGSTFGGENAEPGSRGGGLGAENGHPPVGKGPETVGKVLEMWYEMERRGAAVDELEGGLEGERSAAKEGLEEEISAAKEGLEGERSAAKEDLEGKRSAAKEGLETGENEAAKTGAGGMSGDAVVDASQGNADPESVAHEQAPSVGMASGHVAPVRPPLERSTEPLDLDISSRPLDWYVQPGQGLGAVGQAAGVATGTGIAAPEDVAPVPNPGEPRGKVHKKTSHKKKVQWDRVPAGEADLGSAEAKEPGPEDLQKEGTRGEQRQAEEAAEGPRGSDEKQCAACGVTQSRRWYGASAGACKCSKCYDREYDMKKRAREGNGPEEAVVLTKGRKRQRKESSTVKAGGGTAVAALALAGPEVQFEGATGTGGSVMKADGGNEVKTGARVKETPKKWKGSLEKKGKQSVPMGAEERGGKVGTKGDFEKAPKEKTGGAEATGKQVARFGAAYERENVKRRRSIEGTAEEKTGGAEEEGNQLVRPGAEERGGEIETKGHFERARKRRIGDTEGQGIPAVERGAAYDQDKAKARGRSEGAAKEKTGGSEEEEERVGKEGAGGEKAGDDIGAEGAAAAVTKGANDGAAKLDSERVGGEEEKAASDGGMGRAERWGNDRAMEGGGKKETAKVNSGAQKGNDAERGEEGAPGTESGDPPAKRGVQGFVGEILRVMSETGAEAAEPDEARVVLEADKGGKENENGVFRGAAAAEVGKTREAAEAEEGAGTETAGTAVGPGKETGLGGLDSAQTVPPLFPPMNTTDSLSAVEKQPTPSAEAAQEKPPTSANAKTAAPKEAGPADLSKRASKPLAADQPGETDPLTEERGADKFPERPRAKEGVRGIPQGEGKLSAPEKAPGLAAGSKELAGREEVVGGVPGETARVDGTRAEEESTDVAFRGGDVEAVRKGADGDLGTRSDVAADVTGEGRDDASKGGSADVTTDQIADAPTKPDLLAGIERGEKGAAGDADVTPDRSADAPTKPDLLAEIERELQDRERAVDASASLGGSPAKKRRAGRSPLAREALLRRYIQIGDVIPGVPEVTPKVANGAAGAADITGGSGAGDSKERNPVPEETAVGPPVAQLEDRTEATQRGGGPEGETSNGADVTAGGSADVTEARDGPGSKDGHTEGLRADQERITGQNGMQEQERRGPLESKETSGGEAPRPTVPGDQAGASQQTAGVGVQVGVADAKGGAPAGATCQVERRPAAGSIWASLAEELPAAASYGSIWKAYAEKLPVPGGGGPSAPGTEGVTSASVGAPGVSVEAGPEPWAEVAAALRGLIQATEDRGRAIGTGFEALLTALEPLWAGGVRQGPRATGGAAPETGALSVGRAAAPSTGPATPPESPGQAPTKATSSGGAEVTRADVNNGGSEMADGDGAAAQAGS